MKLIDLLVQELPKLGGWAFGQNAVYQDWDGELRIDSEYNTTTKLFLPLSEFVRERGKTKRTLRDDAFVTREQYEAALAASKQPAWSGEGLPPVGTECEYSGNGSWARCKVVAQGREHTIINTTCDQECVLLTCAFMFRPIRTEAERKRDKFIAAIGNEDIIGTYITKDDAEFIYDAIAAGKIPHVKLD